MNNHPDTQDRPHDQPSDRPQAPRDRILDIAVGHREPHPVPHSVACDASYHAGLQDADLYDLDALNPDRPIRTDTELTHTATRAFETQVNHLLDQITVQDDLIKDRRADDAAAKHAVGAAQTAADGAVSTAKTAIDDAKATVPDVDGRTTSTTGARGRGDWRNRVDKGLVVTILFFLGAEIGVNFIAMLYLREDVAVTLTLAISVSVALIGATFYLAKNAALTPADTHPRRVGPVIVAVVIVTILLTLVGTGVMRYEYTLQAVLEGIANNAGLAPGIPLPPELAPPAYARLGLLAFSFALPLLFAVITFVKVRTSDFAIITNVRSLRQTAHDLADMYAAAVHTRTMASEELHNAEGGLERLRALTETATRAERGKRIEILGAYYRGLARGLSDPAATARLDRRHDLATDTLITQVDKETSEALARLRDLNLGPARTPAQSPTGITT